MAAWCPASSGGGGRAVQKFWGHQATRRKVNDAFKANDLKMQILLSMTTYDLYIFIIIYCIHHLIICIYLHLKQAKSNSGQSDRKCAGSNKWWAVYIEAKLHSATPRPNFSHNSKIQHIHMVENYITWIAQIKKWSLSMLTLRNGPPGTNFPAVWLPSMQVCTTSVCMIATCWQTTWWHYYRNPIPCKRCFCSPHDYSTLICWNSLIYTILHACYRIFAPWVFVNFLQKLLLFFCWQHSVQFKSNYSVKAKDHWRCWRFWSEYQGANKMKLWHVILPHTPI